MVRPPWAAAPSGDSICGLRLYSQLLSSHVFFSCFAQTMYFQFLPTHVFSARAFVPGFLTVSILEIDKIVRTSEYMTFSTFQKRRAPENHEFSRY